MPASRSYAIVDTGQTTVYGTVHALTALPQAGDAFFGQDAQYTGNQPAYRDNGDGTVTDLVTGLMWQKTPLNNVSYADAVAGADDATTGGHADWRLPTIKELYSLIDFSGYTGQTAADSTPYLNDDVFDFAYGDESAGERFMDVQYWSATEYVGTTMNGNATTFGVNFADGRIKGYPNQDKLGEVLYVRGNPDYGVNRFADNGDGTITDTATGLTWLQADSGQAMTWEEALAWAESLTAGGSGDWRLPNAKELQSLVDYTRAPDPTVPTADTVGPAIDPVFSLTNIGTAADPDYPYLWTSTTHVEGGTGSSAAYVAFGKALGWMQDDRTGDYTLLDVHGAGAQRSVMKTGDADDYPYGFGPQGDVVRIENYALAVMDTAAAVPVSLETGSHDSAYDVHRFYNPATGAHFFTASDAEAQSVLDTLPGFTYEGNGFDSNATEADGMAVYRFYNTATGTHFYTADPAERDTVADTLPGYSYEGVAYYAHAADTDGTVGLHRFYNTATGTHFYTISDDEAATLQQTLPGYAYEGVLWAVEAA
jgi:hypothetical protein